MDIDVSRKSLKSSSNTKNAPCLYNPCPSSFTFLPNPSNFYKAKTANGLKPIIFFPFSTVKILSLKRVDHYLFKILLNAGDVDLNLGPQTIYKILAQIFNREEQKLKYFNFNCQSLLKKRNTLKDVPNDLGENTIHGITETWLSG